MILVNDRTEVKIGRSYDGPEEHESSGVGRLRGLQSGLFIAQAHMQQAQLHLQFILCLILKHHMQYICYSCGKFAPTPVMRITKNPAAQVRFSRRLR